jgi:hypothetical protein
VVVSQSSFSLKCPADYHVQANDGNGGAIVDLTQDLLNGAVVDMCGGVDDIAISDPLPANAARLSPGPNVITVSGVDTNGNPASCTYVVEVASVGACCGAPNVGCIDGVGLADCPDGANWIANGKCSEDCGDLCEIDHCFKSHSHSITFRRIVLSCRWMQNHTEREMRSETIRCWRAHVQTRLWSVLWRQCRRSLSR